MASSVFKRSPAVEVARAAIEAWSNHDLDSARQLLAPNVHVTAMTTRDRAPTDLMGIDSYMAGLQQLAQAVTPGSAQIIASEGDARNALILVTVEASFDGSPPRQKLAGGRLYLLDDDQKIVEERVVFYTSPR